MRERRLQRRARTRLLGCVGAAALFVVALAYSLPRLAGQRAGRHARLPGPGDGGMYDSIGAGFDDAVARLGLDAQR